MQLLYDRLTRNDAVKPVDLIFVMAGRMDRKQYGMQLFSNGVSPKLVLSVGRFEVSRMAALGLDHFTELKRLRDQTQPEARHFFVTLDASCVRIDTAGIPNWNTYGEVLGLRRILQYEPVRRVMIVSTNIHLNRVSVAVAKLCRGMQVEFRYCAVPDTLAATRRENWWLRTHDRQFVATELLKLAGYRIIVSLPPSISAWLMRLKDHT